MHIVELDAACQAHRGRQRGPRALGPVALDLDQVAVQAFEGGEVELQPRGLPEHLLQRREEPQAGEGVHSEERQQPLQRAVIGDQHHHDQEQHAAEGDAFEHVARGLAHHHVGGDGTGHLARRRAEALHITPARAP